MGVSPCLPDPSQNSTGPHSNCCEGKPLVRTEASWEMEAEQKGPERGLLGQGARNEGLSTLMGM